MSGTHATLGQLRTRNDYLCVVKQIQAIAGQPVTGKGCNIIYDPPEARIE
jgi:hypothetical protein